MRTFTITAANGIRIGQVKADFITRPSFEVHFWVKPHWWKRRRCVAVVDWQYIVAIDSLPVKSDAEIAREMGVAL